ncbi:MAG: hypothetical protein QXL10_00825 [Candidatus Bathyarchaeia archaeon]
MPYAPYSVEDLLAAFAIFFMEHCHDELDILTLLARFFYCPTVSVAYLFYQVKSIARTGSIAFLKEMLLNVFRYSNAVVFVDELFSSVHKEPDKGKSPCAVM